MLRMGTNRVVVYTRQSVAREESISLELQEKACREYAAQRGYVVVEVLSDPGISGLQFAKRPGIRKAIEMVEDGSADVVVVWRWSRLSRKRTDQAVILDRIEKAGGRAESAQEPIDATNAGGRFSREVLLAMAAFESEVKSEQWGETHKRRVEMGLPPTGQQMFGYIKTKDGYEQDPQTAPILKEMYTRFINGQGIPSITEWLNEIGAVTTRGGTWTTWTTRYILNNGFAAGIFEWDGKEYEGSWEPVISQDIWKAYLRAKKARAAKPKKVQNPKWHLQGIAVCGKCGGPMKQSGSANGQRRLACSNRIHRGKSVCEGIWTFRNWVDKKIAFYIGANLEAWAAATPVDTEKRARLENEKATAEDAAQSAQDALGRLTTLLAKGLVTEDDYRASQADLAAERDAALARAEEAATALDEIPDGDDLFDRIAAGATDDIGQWNQTISKIIASIKVHADHLIVTDTHGVEKRLEKKN
jgi:site-specific DNA recombinase